MSKHLLSEICSYITDGEHGTVPYDECGEFFLLSAKNLVDGHIVFQNDERKIRKADFDLIRKRTKLSSNDVVLSTTGTIGNLAIIKDCSNYDFNRDVGILKCNPEKVVPEFLYLYLSLPYMQAKLQRISKGGTQKHLYISDLEELEIDIPTDVGEQKKRVFLLMLLNKKIALNNRLNATLEAMAKTLYDYWFVQFDFPDEKSRPYKTSGGKMVCNEELGREIPAGWEVKRVKDLLDVVTGKEDANFSVLNGAYNFFTCSNEVLRCDSSAFEGSAVLLAGNGNFNVKHYTGKFNAYQRTYVLIPNDQKYYAVLYISVQDMVQALINNSNGSIVKFITKSDVENIPVLDSPCRKLYNCLNKIYSSIETRTEENRRLAALRDWLLPMLMNGQVGFRKGKGK